VRRIARALLGRGGHSTPVTYQWKRNGSPLSNGWEHLGADSIHLDDLSGTRG
jgi:hypothetical protein